MDTFAVIPSPRGDGFVELSADDDDLVELARKPAGRVFRKQILERGPLHYGGRVVNIDDDFIDTMVANFSAGVCDIVQAPKAGDKNEHTENPDRNVGEVIALHKTKKGLYADIDVRTDDADKMGKTLLGASAMLHLDYTDTKTNKRVGPTLLHTAITNRPYVTGLDGYEEIIAASAPGGDEYETVVLTASTPTQEVLPMTYEEWVAAGKADHNIDVPALKAKADEGVKLSNAVVSNLTEHGLIQLSNGAEVGPSDVIGMVVASGAKIVELTATIDEARQREAQKDAESAVDELVAAGRIMPAARDAHVKLKLSNPEIFEEVVPEKPLVMLSNEEGEVSGDPAHEASVEAEIARLSAVAKDKLDAPISVGS